MDFRYVDTEQSNIEGDNGIITSTSNDNNNTLLADYTNRSTPIFSIKTDFITQW